MPLPQAITAPTGLHQYHLEFLLRPDVDLGLLRESVRRLWSNEVTGRTNVAGGPAVQPAGGLTGLVVGFGPTLWDRMAPGQAPESLRPASPIRTADGAGVPPTQRDLWVWLNGSQVGTVLDAALTVVRLLGPAATAVLEQPCFVHQDSRTWEGFIDGTENPNPFRAPEVVLVPDGQPGAGGSTAIVQRWINDDIDRFEALPVDEQERVFGRTKRDSVELDPLPPSSHVARTTLEVEGEELKIYRRNIPFGRVGERGYMFIAFAADQTRVTRMLERMYGVDAGPGRPAVVDALTTYVHPVSSSSYFVPSMDALETSGMGPSED